MASFITFLRKCETSISSFNSNRCRGYTLGIYADEKAEYVGKLSASANMPTHSEFFGRFANFRLGYVGAIDGFFQRTLMPRKKDCANNQTAYAYVSGQYEHYGVNCLGICDVKGRYLFFVPNHQEKQTTHCRLSTLDVTKFERYASQFIRCW